MIQALKHKRVRRIVAGLMMASFMMDFINSWLAPDDPDGGEDEWDKISDWDKEHNLIVMNPWVDDFGGPVLLKLPMPYGYNVFATIGLKAGAVARGKLSPMEAAVDVALAAMSAFNPIGGGHDLESTITPTIAQPLQELGRNQNFMGTPILPPKNPYGPPTPDSERYFSSVSKISKWGAEEINKLTGGNQDFGGDVDVSPETVDHLFQFFTGGAGAFAQRSVNFTAKAMAGEDIEWREVPIARRFVGGPNKFHDRMRYREIRDSVLILDRALKSNQRTGREKYLLRRDHPVELKMRGMIADTEKEVRALYRDRSQVRSQVNIDAINEKITAEMKRANARYEQLLRAQ